MVVVVVLVRACERGAGEKLYTAFRVWACSGFAVSCGIDSIDIRVALLEVFGDAPHVGFRFQRP